MATQPKYKVKEIVQVAMVVKDIEKAVRNYWDLFGIGPWNIYTNGPNLQKVTYMGKPNHYKNRVAIARVGSLSFELIQPLEGNSIQRDFMAQHGEGIHHLAFVVPSLEEGMQGMAEAGLKVIQSGQGLDQEGRGGYAYLSTIDDLATIFELLEASSGAGRTPEAVYPPLDGDR